MAMNDAHTRNGVRVGEAAEFLGVSPDTVRRWADSGRLKAIKAKSGRRLIDAAELAAFARREAPAALGQRSMPPIVSESARNRFGGIITRVVKDKVVAQVEIQAGPHRIVSLMTREAADELGLAPGVRAVAAVKATAVVVELPRN